MIRIRLSLIPKPLPKPPFDAPYLVREPTVEEYMKRADCRLIPENANPKKKKKDSPRPNAIAQKRHMLL